MFYLYNKKSIEPSYGIVVVYFVCDFYSKFIMLSKQSFALQQKQCRGIR